MGYHFSYQLVEVKTHLEFPDFSDKSIKCRNPLTIAEGFLREFLLLKRQPPVQQSLQYSVPGVFLQGQQVLQVRPVQRLLVVGQGLAAL
mgnify:CR=1 FL=1